ncbi:hypothetical protein [Albibacterium indicum]|uniref:hypothetical protein n=1 Tax=Albibacterium indicum TaxID=2292082 RepID=UPI0013002512|nr:hypothetical protein [Pedobacter indicus]
MKVAMILFCFLCTLNVAHGQSQSAKEAKTLRITVPAQNDFGDEHIEQVIFSLNDDTVFSVRVYPNKDDTAYLNREFLHNGYPRHAFYFDMGFEADRLVLVKKFPGIKMPVLPNTEMYNVYQQKKDDVQYKIASIDSYRDSMTYRFYSYSGPEDIKKPTKGGTGFGHPARYLGDIQKLADDIAREVASSSVNIPFDSVLVFQSIVQRFDKRTHGDKVFVLEGLIFGDSSVFSEIAAKHLQAEENRFFEDGETKWRPAHGDLSRNTRVKIYVRLEQDGTVTIKLPRYLGNWTGD